MDECEEGTPRSSRERSGVCFGGFRPPKQVEEPRVLARGAPLLGLGGEGMGSPKSLASNYRRQAFVFWSPPQISNFHFFGTQGAERRSSAPKAAVILIKIIPEA